ncbi:MAG: DNA internalization-related competence protein ComEC/Rec2 [Bacilli bacterium]|nr:DNA internalization-related competence protein ComEC/Rec2 [Bacilli bacterium]
MKVLKIKLLFKIILSVFFLFVICRTYYITKNKLVYSEYDGIETSIIGIITDMEIDGNQLTMEIKAKEKIKAYYYFKSEDEKNNFTLLYKTGYKIEMMGSLNVPSNNTIFNIFNFKEYLLSQKINWLFNIDSFNLISKNTDIIYKIKNSIINRIDKLKYSSHYVKAFIIGIKDDINSDVLTSYQKIGISHLLAISGMHVTSLGTILLKIFNKIIKRKQINYFLTFVIIFFYALLNNFTPSVLRASLMFILLSINQVKHLKVKSLWILLIIFMLLLYYNPYYIYSTSFIFTFVISFFLILAQNLIAQKKGYLDKLFIISLLAFLISIPILSYFFFEVNLLSPVFNLIFIPLVNVIIFPLVLLTFLIPLLDQILYVFIVILEKISILCENVDFFTVILAKPHLVIILLYYILILLLILKKQKKYIYLLIILFVCHANIKYFDFDNELTMIDVGQGDSFLIEFKNNSSNILIDTGGKVTYNNEEWTKKNNTYDSTDTIIPFLKSKGIKKLDYLILTHGDNDHVKETINIINNFEVEIVIFNNDDFNDLELEIIDVLNKKNINYYQNIKELNINNNKLYFLNNKLYDNENDNSNVIYLNFNNTKILLMGDAGTEVEEDIISKYNLNDIDILKVGHHGSSTSSSIRFINTINPKYSLISVGKNNSYGHPNDEVLEILSNSIIYRTDQKGSVTFQIRNNQIVVKTCLP